MRARHLLLIVAAVAAMTSLPARAQSPTPTVVDAPVALQPLRIVAAAPNLEIRQAPLIDDGGQLRQSGLVSILAGATFNTGVIAAIEPAVELLRDQPPDLTGVRIIVVRIPDQGIDAVMGGIRGLPGVVAADKSYVMSLHTSDPVWELQLDAGLAFLDLPRAWSVSAGAASVRVAVLDTGVNEIADLAGRVDAGRNFLAFSDPADTSDPVGHGTSMAAIIGASIDNDKGIAGVAPNVHIVPVKACESNSGLFSCLSNYVIPALSWVASEALAGRIDVLNMSFGGSANTAIEYYLGIIRNAGVIVSASAGNSGTALLDYPASSPNVVAVGGTLPDGTRHPQSSYGAGLGVAAPYQTYSLNNNSAITYSGGTSLSAATISGLAALFKSTQPRVPPTGGSDFVNGLGGFLNAMIQNPHAAAWTPGRVWNPETGYGTPNAFSTVWAHACVRYDFNHDGVIDILDEQAIVFRYGQFAGWYFGGTGPDDWHYSVQYDVEPALQPDGDIDIKDVQSVFLRNGFVCPQRQTRRTGRRWAATTPTSCRAKAAPATRSGRSSSWKARTRRPRVTWPTTG